MSRYYRTLLTLGEVPFAWDTDALAYISAIGITDDTEKLNIDSFVKALKSNSLWSRCQAIWPFRGSSATAHKFNLKNPVDSDAAFRLTFHGGGTHSSAGYLVNGTNAYARTYFNPATHQNVNSNGFTWVLGTNNTKGSDALDLGVQQSGTARSYATSKRGGFSYAQILLNGTPADSGGATITDVRGVHSASRQSSTVAKLIKNNATLINQGGADGSLPNGEMYIGCVNAGGPYGYSNNRFQVVIMHEGFSDSDITILQSIIATFENNSGRKTW